MGTQWGPKNLKRSPWGHGSPNGVPLGYSAELYSPGNSQIDHHLFRILPSASTTLHPDSTVPITCIQDIQIGWGGFNNPGSPFLASSELGSSSMALLYTSIAFLAWKEVLLVKRQVLVSESKDLPGPLPSGHLLFSGRPSQRLGPLRWRCHNPGVQIVC